jgi:hypothetical protein
MVCMSQLSQILDKPEASQLYRSILNYMKSADFDPQYELDNQEELIRLFFL